MLVKMAGKCSIFVVLNVLFWAASGQDKDLGKRMQGMEDRIQWLTTEHRNMTNVVTKLHHRLHNTHHKMTEIKGKELLREKLITDMRDQLEQQSNAITRLEQDNEQLRGVILQLSQAVQEIRGQSLGTTLAPIMKTTKSTVPTTPRGK
jgi:chromosome segregation ATPase